MTSTESEERDASVSVLSIVISLGADKASEAEERWLARGVGPEGVLVDAVAESCAVEGALVAVLSVSIGSPSPFMLISSFDGSKQGCGSSMTASAGAPSPPPSSSRARST